MCGKNQKRAVFFWVGVTLLIAGCAPVAPLPGAPKAEGPKWPPPPSSWVYAWSTTGSYGNETGQTTIRSLGEQSYEGKKVMAFNDGVSTAYLDLQGRWLATVRGNTPIFSAEPYDALFDWPLSVGKLWVNRYRYRDHERGRTFDNVAWDGEVVAYEDVTTKAGGFKAFKIVQQNRFASVTRWWSPDLGITVKSRWDRQSTHYLGAGTREEELVSHDIKR